MYIVRIEEEVRPRCSFSECEGERVSRLFPELGLELFADLIIAG
jgi:hypothetical protein